jgi:prepilin-type processing-associated H-X9-DG protein
VAPPYQYLGPDSHGAIPRSIPDGTANTILFGEKYAQCKSNTIIDVGQSPPGPWSGGSLWAYDNLSGPIATPGGSAWFSDWFAGIEIQFFDYIPGTANVGVATVPQIKPVWNGGCNPGIASTGHTGAMNACMADGSARAISGTVSGTTWYALCTPNGEDVIGSDF